MQMESNSVIWTPVGVLQIMLNPQLSLNAGLLAQYLHVVSATTGAAHEVVNLKKGDVQAAMYWAAKQNATDQATRQGSVAGALLKLIHQRAVDLPDTEPSLKKAIDEVSAFAKNRTFGDDRWMPTSKTQIREAWDLFKPVSHLWAAFEWSKDPTSPFKHKHGALLKSFAHDEDEFRLFLGLARGISDFATTFVQKRAKGQPFINPSDLVKIPEHYPAVRLTLKAPQPIRDSGPPK